jgi:CheY-like chemotaxis protein
MNKVLIIEDDQIFANTYRNKFLVEGFEVEVALDGETGLDLVRQFQPDAILLDLILPKMSGVDVIRRIRGEDALKRLPIVVFSNTYLTSMVQEAWKAGASKCLSKANCPPRQVLQAVSSLIETKAAPPPAAPPEEESGCEDIPASAADTESQSEHRREFVVSWPAAIAQLRSVLQATIRAEGEAMRVQQVLQLYRRVHSLTGNASLAGLLRIAQMSSALEALLRELHDKPKNINTSTLRTAASAVDALCILFHDGRPADSCDFTVLVVDDEAIARRAISYALSKAKMKAVTVADPLQALQLLPQRRFDLIFLDVTMPVMDGFELCSRLRTLPAYKKTPVVFVTSLTDLETRANSTMSGGNDIIAKPFLFLELAVKALVHAIRAQPEPEPATA